MRVNGQKNLFENTNKANFFLINSHSAYTLVSANLRATTIYGKIQRKTLVLPIYGVPYVGETCKVSAIVPYMRVAPNLPESKVITKVNKKLLGFTNLIQRQVLRLLAFPHLIR
jgi:hypothetical protein